MKTETDRLLQGFAIASNHLVNIHDGHASVQAGLGALGLALEVDRIYIFEYPLHPQTEEWAASQRWEWVNEGIDNPALQDFSWAELFPRWFPILTQDQPLSGLIKDFPESEQAVLAPQGILSILVVPIFIQDQCWGFIRFDDCHQERVWESNTQSVLKSIAGTIGSVIARWQAEANAKNLATCLQEAQRIAHIGNWELNLQNNTLFWSEEVFRIFEIDPHRFGASYEAFLGLVHPEDRPLVESAYGKHISDHQPYELVHRLQMSDGRIKYVRERCETTYDVGGIPLVSQGTVQDITEQKEAELRREWAEAALRKVVEGTAAVTGEHFFSNLVRHLADVLQVRYALVTELVDQQLHSLGFCVAGELQPPLSYLVAKTPCEKTLQDGEYLCGQSVQEVFLEDVDLVMMAAESYLGVALKNDRGESIGDLCVLDTKPMSPEQLDAARQVLRVFAARASAELQRQKLLTQLHQLNQELEARVEQREIRYRSLMEHAPDAIMLANSEGYIVEANRKAEEMFGYALQELTTLHFTQLHPPKELPKITAIFAAMAKNQLTQAADIVFLRRDGTKLPVDVTAGIIQLNDEVLIQGIFRDISDRKQAERALRESQQLLQTVLDTVPLSVFWKDRTSSYLGANRRFLQDACLNTVSELVGKNDFDLPWGATEADIYQADDRNVMNSGEAKLGIVETQSNQDGKRIWLETNKLPLRNLSGDVVGVLGTYQDISDRVATEMLVREQAQRETLLREITQRVRQSLDLQTIFDTACHEIRAGLQSDRVGIFKFYPDSHWNDGEFVAESVVEGFDSALAIRVHDHCFGEEYAPLYLQGSYSAIEDIYQLQSQCHIDVLAQFQVRAALTVPLLEGNNLWGLLCIHQCSGTRQWLPSELDLAQQITSQLAIAIQQATLYAKAQSELQEKQEAEAKIALQLKQQQTLATITRLLQQSLDLERIQTIIVHQVKEVLQAERVIIFRLYPNGSSRIVEEAVVEGLPRLRDKHWDDEVWSQDILDCYWQGQPRIVPDVMTDRWTDCLMEYSIEGQIQSKMVAPILQELGHDDNHRWVSPTAAHKLWGVLVVHACTQKRVWQETEAQLLQQIANQVAIAIQQSDLFDQLQQELIDRKQAQNQLTETNHKLSITNTELERATRLKDEFLANMSHELRTPLNAILGMTEGLQEEVFGIVNDRQLKALSTVEKSASHLLSLINDILDVAKIESGQVSLDYSQVSVRQLCSSSLSFVKQQAFNKNIQLHTEIPSNLATISVDEVRIRQVLINLLTNAVKFTLEGGTVNLTVSLLSQENSSPNYLRIAVTDTGIGISPENVAKLFKPFVQIDGALNRRQTGTGLGLALVKQIVELHGGKVGLTSELGVGSCFTIDLPYTNLGSQAGSLPPAQESTPPLSLANAPTSDQPPLVLLAEDNPDNVATISTYLEAKGYGILLAGNGWEAIDLSISHQPDVILMDIQMPGMDGLEAMGQIRQQSSLQDTPIIALTALAMKSDQERCLAAGADYYLSKPVKLKQLDNLLKEILADRRSAS
jgi:PAS domain S-box-containing protein